MKRVIWLVGIALAISCGMFARLQAFSLGEIEVQSYLGAPFVAEVSLVIDAYERDDGIVATVGDAQEYEAEGLPRPPVVDLLRPAVSTDDPARVLIFSEEPIQIPSFNLLLSIRSGTVTIVRSYAVTLSAPPLSIPVASQPLAHEMTQMAEAVPPPPVETTSSQEQPAPEQAPTAQQATTPEKTLVAEEPATPQKSRPIVAQRQKRRRTAPSTVPAWAKKLPKVYGPVQEGETLYRVVETLGVPKSYTWQVVVHLWRENSNRFFAGNIHGLLTGLYLRLPEKNEWGKIITAMSLEEAQHIVDEQWDAWRELRRAALRQQRELQHALSKPQAIETVQIESQPEDTQGTQPSVVLSTQAPSAMVTVTELQSVLQGLEERLAQRLSVPSTLAEGQSNESVAFVSAAELQTALRGLEGRLSEQLTQVTKHQKLLEKTTAVLSPQTIAPSFQHGAGIEALLRPLFSTSTIIYVLIFQNVILFVLASGFAWRWYRNRI